MGIPTPNLAGRLMEIHFGPGARNVDFVPDDGILHAHVKWTYREHGPQHDAFPAGVTYCWWDDPANLSRLIARLQEVHAEYELWLTKELARYQAEGSPMSEEQVFRIDQARAAGLI